MEPKDILFEQIVKDRYDKILSFFIINLSDKSVAEDYTQEVFAALWKSIDDLMKNPNTNYNTWLSAVAYNQLKVFIKRKQSSQKNIVDAVGENIDIETTNVISSAEDEFIEFDNSLDEQKKIEIAGELLPYQHQELFRLLYIEKLNYSDIAKRLNINNIALRVRILRLRKKLYEICKNLGFIM